MTHREQLAILAALILLAALAILFPRPAASDVGYGSGGAAHIQVEFVPVRTAGSRGVGNTPSPAVHQSRTNSTVPSPSVRPSVEVSVRW